MRQFSPPHLAALAVLVILSVLAIWAPRRYPGRWVTAAERLLAAAIFAGWAGEYVADVVTHTWSVEYTLPLQLTDAVSVVAILALLTERQALIELVYFWSLTASLQAVLTPDLAQNFPSVYYFTYFIYHVGAIVAALLLVFGLRRYPRRGAALLVFAATLAWAAIAGTADVITGGNYMYLSEKPVHNSLLNVMGPWPWYIVTTGALGLGMLLVLELLTSWIRRRDLGTVAGRRASAPVQP